jgi:hypothetical protein
MNVGHQSVAVQYSWPSARYPTLSAACHPANRSSQVGADTGRSREALIGQLLPTTIVARLIYAALTYRSVEMSTYQRTVDLYWTRPPKVVLSDITI